MFPWHYRKKVRISFSNKFGTLFHFNFSDALLCSQLNSSKGEKKMIVGKALWASRTGPNQTYTRFCYEIKHGFSLPVGHFLITFCQSFN
jgi:hypothetical protein